MDSVQQQDPQIARILDSELGRLRSKLNLIASENLPSRAVLETLGSCLTTKYAEGYPGRRYYGGCEFVDEAELLAIERAKELFGAEHANVQPHAGAQANMAAYFAFMKPGDTLLGMNLAHGGHLTHGSPVNFSGRLYEIAAYEVEKDSELIDYDRVRDIARKAKPRMVVAGATAYPRVFDFEAFRSIADEVGAVFLCDAAHFIGLVAGGAHPSPVPHADVVTFTTHKTLRGPRGGMILSRAEHAKALDSAVFPRVQGGPLMHVVAAKAVSLREAAQPEFREYAAQVVANARELAAALAAEGLRIVSGGTDTHLVLADVTPLGLTGAEAERRLDLVGVTLNKNAIPFDTRPPAVASGIRVGTPILTTVGMKQQEMRRVAGVIGRALRDESEATATWAREEVRELTAAFPAYPGLNAVAAAAGAG
ncbi:MAG TPA: serine hydroxymethyltransferase [Actinomycetota bacterium]|nr:serine hydroxymethyltransferase [Actinomycetota bacterium]